MWDVVWGGGGSFNVSHFIEKNTQFRNKKNLEKIREMHACLKKTKEKVSGAHANPYQKNMFALTTLGCRITYFGCRNPKSQEKQRHCRISSGMLNTAFPLFFWDPTPLIF